MKKINKYVVLSILFLAIVITGVVVKKEVSFAAGKVTKISSKLKYDRDYYNCKLSLKGKDKYGNVVWSYKSPKCPLTELDTNQFFVNGNNIYVFSDKLYCIDKQTGRKKWTISNLGLGGVCAKFDKKGNMYCAGYYDGALICVSKKGKVLFNTSLGSSYPYMIKIKSNKIHIAVTKMGEESLNTTYFVYTKKGKYIKTVVEN